MTYETILLTQHGNLFCLSLNRPDRLNSFNVKMHEEIRSALDAIEAAKARALLITGTGRGFCAGQDLSDRKRGPGIAVDLGHSLDTYYNPLIRRLAGLNFPVICAVNGVAAGAGASFALAADIVFAARSARFVQSFAKMGLLPDSGGSWVMPRQIGQARALGLALTGEPLSAERAEAWGLIWKCVDDAELMPAAMALAQSLANGPTLGLAATKHAIRGSGLKTLASALDHERDVMRELGQSEDYNEGVSAFLEKRAPHFEGR